jgi:hypothetical protein
MLGALTRHVEESCRSANKDTAERAFLQKMKLAG